MQAILFDHDGVLADSESVFFDSNRAAFADYGIELDHAAWGELYLSDDSRTPDVARRLGLSAQDTECLIEARDKIYRRMLDQGVALMPGVRESIAALHGRLRMAIVTGCPRRQIDHIHGSGDFLEYFECVVTADDCAFGKPHPEPYLRAMDRLGLQAADCVAIEDSPCGLSSAVAAGLRCIVIETPLTDLRACGAAWKIVSSLAEALDFLSA
jgi:HAD superfamily hydrolase (TIGR01509 family)